MIAPPNDRKIWDSMRALCRDFADHRINLRNLVVGLEGLMNAGEFKDQGLRDQWYRHWLPLEIRIATGDVNWSPESAAEVRALGEFLSAIADFDGGKESTS